MARIKTKRRGSPQSEWLVRIHSSEVAGEKWDAIKAASGLSTEGHRQEILGLIAAYRSAKQADDVLVAARKRVARRQRELGKIIEFLSSADEDEDLLTAALPLRPAGVVLDREIFSAPLPSLLHIGATLARVQQGMGGGPGRPQRTAALQLVRGLAWLLMRSTDERLHRSKKRFRTRPGGHDHKLFCRLVAEIANPDIIEATIDEAMKDCIQEYRNDKFIEIAWVEPVHVPAVGESR